MNKRQKKIMVPYEEKTDTCPDCSNIPCDCGIPAGYTPRTDDGGRYCSHQRRKRWIKQPINTMNTPTPRTDKCLTFDSIALCETLERELAAVTEQRDGLRSAVDYASDQLTRVTEQRDRLANLVRQFISILDITEESDSGRLFHPTNITSCRAGDLQKAGELVEALRRASR